MERGGRTLTPDSFHSRRGRTYLTELAGSGAGYLHGFGIRIIQSQRGQSSPPDATRIESGDIPVVEETQGRPVTEDDARSAPAGVSGLEPRDQRFRLRLFRRSLGPQHQAAVRVDEAQPREALCDQPHAPLGI